MIVEYTRYKIDEQRRATFEKVYKKAVESLGASSHCLAYEFSHCTEDPSTTSCASNGIPKKAT